MLPYLSEGSSRLLTTEKFTTEDEVAEVEG